MSSNAGKEAIVNMARLEMEFRVELFNKMTNSCCEKCIGKNYKDPDLNLGETSCVDRCVSKYHQVTSIIGQMLQSPGPM